MAYIVSELISNCTDSVYEFINSNYTETVSFTIFVGSIITFSSIVTLLCSNPKYRCDDIFISSMNRKIGNISNEIIYIHQNIEDINKNNKEIKFRLEIQDAEIKEIDGRMEKIEDCLTESE